eukprot:7247795-Pyramimonas_sp.AAC.1
MGRFWSLRLPQAWRSTIIRGLVQGSVLSGMEPFLLSSKQMETMDRHLARLGRMAMRGRACTMGEDGSTHTLDTRAFLAHWG